MRSVEWVLEIMYQITKARANISPSFLLPIGLFLASLAVYIYTLAPGMLRGDSGEFQYAMVTLEPPHAPGYPLYTLLGWLWLHLIPLGTLAYRANLLSAFFGALTVSLICLITMRMTRRPLASLAGALYLAFSYVFWSQSVITEVYTFNAFFLALLIYLLLLWGERTQLERENHRLLYAIALLYGLSLAHHRLMLLVFPALLLFIWQVNRQILLDRGLLLRLGAFLTLGSSIYLYIPLRVLFRRGALSKALFSKVLGGGFLSSFLGLRSDPLRLIFWLPQEQFGYLGLLLGGIGVYALLRHKRTHPLGFFLLITYCTTLLFSLFYRAWDIQVFLTPAFLTLALWIGLGVAFVAAFLPRYLRFGLEATVVLSALLLLWGNYPRLTAYTARVDGGIEAEAREVLNYPLEEGAILKADWVMATALQYLQRVEGLRADIRVSGIALKDKRDYERLLTILDSDQPVYFSLFGELNITRLPFGYLLEPIDGRFLRVTKGESSPVMVEKRIEERVSLWGYEEREDGFAIYWMVEGGLERDHITYLHAFDLDQEALWQEDKEATGEAVYIYPTSHWQEGDIVQDIFPSIPPDTAYLRAGLYHLEGEEITPLGQATVFMVRGADPKEISHPLAIELGDALLLGYDLVFERERCELLLYWGAMQPMDGDYNVFIHLLDEGGDILAQGDSQPLGGLYPTSLWRPGDVAPDRHSLPSPPGLAEIRVGLYDWRTGERLSRHDSGQDYVVIKIHD